MYVCVGGGLGCACVVWDPLELELPVAVSCPMWVLETEPNVLCKGRTNSSSLSHLHPLENKKENLKVFRTEVMTQACNLKLWRLR